MPCLAHIGHAQQQGGKATVDATLISKRLPVGDQGHLIVRVVNGRPEAVPDSIPVEGLKITRSGRVEQKINIGTDGQKVEYHIYYGVVAESAGEYTIPAFNVRVDGADLSTQPVTLSVYARDPSDPALDASRPFFANLECETREIWKGQIAPLTLTIYVRGARSINDIGPALLRHDHLVFESDRAYALDAVELQGNLFTTARRSHSVFGLTPGTHTVGPAEIAVAMIDESSPIGRLPGFFQSFTTRTLRTNTLEITVKPLPETGKPASFKGAVGQFEIVAKASPLEIATGDPITIDFEIKGPGNYVTLEAPAFLAPDPKQWRTYEARKTVDPKESSDGVSAGRATFTQIVMPQTEAAAIPPFELAFFNPRTGSYETRRTDPIPIKVTPDPRLAQTVAPIAGGVGSLAATLPEVATPDAQYNDILHIRTTEPAWRPLTASLTAAPLFWVGQIVPALALLSLTGYGLARRVRARMRERAAQKPATLPFKSALHHVADATGDRAAFYRAIDTALDSWLTESGPSGTRNLPSPLKTAFDALRARSQWIVYGATDAAPDGQPVEKTESAEAIQILEALRQRLA